MLQMFTMLIEIFCQGDLHFLDLPRNFEKVIAFYNLERKMSVALKVNKFALNQFLNKKWCK